MTKITCDSNKSSLIASQSFGLNGTVLNVCGDRVKNCPQFPPSNRINLPIN
jgi:hypothetical protein